MVMMKEEDSFHQHFIVRQRHYPRSTIFNETNIMTYEKERKDPL